MGYGVLPLMAGEFRIGKEPELRKTRDDQPIVIIWCVTNGMKKDPANPDGKLIGDDEKTIWVKVTLWKNDGAENAMATYKKDDLVSLVCRPHLQQYEDREGNKRTILVSGKVESFGASTRFRSMPHHTTQQQQPPADDPWGSPTGQQNNQQNGGLQAGNNSWGNGPDTQEPPF